ncbi:2-succinyl-5-enolpyruvyl-6-hydroxy-3-cyclohexene-1-carboxylate synthase [Frankliniella fusca]|uniref:2-succinyl-5-enolpyruvyl-6-hydroxy-3-cyclohexene-1-carboxylate synthase n=1 Tax=Frankliniella fusca TaxID=407009 RepID=A0AAE1HA32_9NEOP|nr:2-succinyl-5-enolpyruvyl-6-hydroxy-3-cyclohexene-1-carboxylate synthase [Frankliniella fusca]
MKDAREDFIVLYVESTENRQWRSSRCRFWSAARKKFHSVTCAGPTQTAASVHLFPGTAAILIDTYQT